MVLVELKSRVCHNGRDHDAGEMIEVSEDQASMLVSVGAAMMAPPPKAAPKPKKSAPKKKASGGE